MRKGKKWMRQRENTEDKREKERDNVEPPKTKGKNGRKEMQAGMRAWKGRKKVNEEEGM